MADSVAQERGPGDLIDDRFRLIERLGSGAMGAVWRALDELLQREVALKEVKPADPGLATDPEFAEMLRTRVLREAQALARIHHPHVVTIHHILDLPGETHPWLVMELVRGGTLEDKLAAGPMAPDEVAELGRGLLGALRAAHAAGICHRDVKPANVLLRPDGSPVLTDFGIAELADTSRLTMTGGLTGSPAYIAPERLYGSEGNPASDLWSLGMLLYVAVEGTHPLRRSTTAATLAAVVSGVVPAATRSGALDPALRAVLVADPAERATAEQLDPLLVRALESGPHHLESPGLAASPPSAPLPPSETAHPSPVGSQQLPAASASSPAAESQDRQPTELRIRSVPVTKHLWTLGPAKKQHTKRRGARVVAGIVISTLVLALTAAAVVIGPAVVPWFRERAGLAAGEPSKRVKPAKSETLLTTAGMEKVIKAFGEGLGTTTFKNLTVYDHYATAYSRAEASSGKSDIYVYTSSGVVDFLNTADDPYTPEVDVSKIDWKLLPDLLERADKSLRVDSPDHRAITVGTNEGVPAILVSLAGEKTSGYLVADLNGNVKAVHPAQ
ncbi:serine/threonine-protein kinase [Microlunatus sp. GCM10028923]|uniref:serine/threonine-protein kinase n=1 Tax=Microlunatus sp. GCM10028923 TaxID=3273400 RepID=UPI00360E5702